MKTEIFKINPNFPDEKLIRKAGEALRLGKLVAFPTETVYGIGANYLDKKAIDRLYDVKKRPRNKPFTIHISKFESLKSLDINLSERALRIINKFWPGPLTILAFNQKGEKLGLRMPGNKVALELINKAGVPIVAPSANISGERPFVSGQEVVSQMKGSVDIILDAGKAEIGIESTVLDVTKEPFRILREGAISEENLLADYHVLFVCTGNSCRSVMAKGMLEKLLKEAGLSGKVLVDSAGTGGFSGIPAAGNTIEIMKEEEVDVSSHRSKAITPELLRKSDFIFVMERMHKNAVLSMFPDAGYKTKLLRENEGIPDPIGRSLEEYRSIKDMIKHKIEDIFLELFKKEKDA